MRGFFFNPSLEGGFELFVLSSPKRRRSSATKPRAPRSANQSPFHATCDIPDSPQLGSYDRIRNLTQHADFGSNSTPRPTAVYASDPASLRCPQNSLPSCLLGWQSRARTSEGRTRGGNRHARPNATAPHSYSSQFPAVCGQRAKPSCRPELRTMRSWRPEIVAIQICVGSLDATTEIPVARFQASLRTLSRSPRASFPHTIITGTATPIANLRIEYRQNSRRRRRGATLGARQAGRDSGGIHQPGNGSI